MKCQVCNDEIVDGGSFCQHCGAPATVLQSQSMSRAVAKLQDLPKCAVAGCNFQIVKTPDRIHRFDLLPMVIGETDWHDLSIAEKDLLRRTYELSRQSSQYAWYSSPETSQTECPNGCKVCEDHGIPVNAFSMKLRYVFGELTIRHLKATCAACSSPWVVEVATDSGDQNVVDIGDVSWQYSAELESQDWNRRWMPLVVTNEGQQEIFPLNRVVRSRNLIVPSMTSLPLGQELWQLKGQDGFISKTAFSPDDRILASASSDGTVCLWDTTAGNSPIGKFQGERDLASGLSFSPDGQRLMATWLNRLVVWSVSDGKRRVDRKIASNRRWHATSIDEAWEVLALAWGNGVSLTNVTGGQTIATFDGHDSEVTAVAVSPDRSLLASSDLEGRVIVWNSRNRRRLYDLRKHQDMVYGLAFDPTGRFLASVSNDRSTMIWDMTNGAMNAHLHGHIHNVYDVTFARDRSALFTAGADGRICMWSLKKQPIESEGIVSLSSIPASSPVTRLYAVSVAGSILELGDYKSGLSINHSGTRIAYAVEDGPIKIWDIQR